MADLTGKSLKNRFFLRKLAGSGGMADVYQAWDEKRSARMAIKVLRRDLAQNPRFFQLFNKEATLLGKLEHPNIVRLYEFDKEGDIVFIVMDWLDGGNLQKKIASRKGPFSLEEVSQVLGPVCNALHYAHENKVYHCDIKPPNIMYHGDGRVQLTDFGVARLASDKEGGGTPTHMAPELFSDGRIDARTDIYALGITMFEMLSGGKVPFDGKSPTSTGTTTRDKIAWEQQNLPAMNIGQYNPSIPPSVEIVVETALQKNPDMRYPSARALQDAFEHARLVTIKKTGTPVTTLQKGAQRTTEIKTSSISHISQALQGIKGAYLFCRSGQQQGKAIPLNGEELTIGRGSDRGLHLDERSVSRRHATIIITRRGIYLRDDGSSLGTLVNGQRLTPAQPELINDGDVIQIGLYEVFEFKKN